MAAASINFDASDLNMDFTLPDQLTPTLVVPAIPNTALNNLEGWLLNALVDCRSGKGNCESVTYFYVDEENYLFADIDDAFIEYFAAEPTSSVTKVTLLRENADLSTDVGLTIGAEISIANLDLDHLFQRVAVRSRNNPSSRELRIIYTADFVHPHDFDGRCIVITADEITSISHERWIQEKDRDHPA